VKDELHSTVMEYQRGMSALGVVHSSCVASLTLARLLFEASCGVGLQARLCGADVRQSRAMSQMNFFFVGQPLFCRIYCSIDGWLLEAQ
jgi:hypothetical protein